MSYRKPVPELLPMDHKKFVEGYQSCLGKLREAGKEMNDVFSRISWLGGAMYTEVAKMADANERLIASLSVLYDQLYKLNEDREKWFKQEAKELASLYAQEMRAAMNGSVRAEQEEAPKA